MDAKENSRLIESRDDPSNKNKQKLAKYQKFVYAVTFMAYAMSHFSRKSYTNVKNEMKEIDGFSTIVFSKMDTGFMFTYAIGSFFSGSLGDRIPPAFVVAAGLIGSSACVMALVIGLWFHFSEQNFFASEWYFPFIWICHGLFQSTGGPVNTAIMSNWFSAEHRGLVFGTWTCHQYIGNVLAAVCAAIVLKVGIQYWWALVIAATANFLWGCFVYFSLPSRPDEVGIQFRGVPTVSSRNVLEKRDKQLPPISFCEALKIPAVAVYAVAFGFFKFVNYVIFFWLPYFLSLSFSPSMSNIISSLYDIGMMPGGIIVGWISDKLNGKRASVCVAFLISLCPLLFVIGRYSTVMPSELLLFLLVLIGILVGGPNNIISSAVAADLAAHPSIYGNHQAIGTVTGIINGGGSITAAVGLLFIGPIQAKLGWASVWYLLIAATILGCVLLLPTVHKELTEHERPTLRALPKVSRISYDSFNGLEGLSVEYDPEKDTFKEVN